MSNITVKIADMQISNNPADTIVTYSLGSCLGITLYDPVIKLGGMLHCMLPLSKADRKKALEKPFMYVDSGMMYFLQQMYDLGGEKSRIEVKVAGGASILDSKGLFRIGERNFTILRKILWKNALLVKGKDVGGDISRTIRLEISTGRFIIKSRGKETEL